MPRGSARSAPPGLCGARVTGQRPGHAPPALCRPRRRVRWASRRAAFAAGRVPSAPDPEPARAAPASPESRHYRRFQRRRAARHQVRPGFRHAAPRRSRATTPSGRTRRARLAGTACACPDACAAASALHGRAARRPCCRPAGTRGWPPASWLYRRQSRGASLGRCGRRPSGQPAGRIAAAVAAGRRPGVGGPVSGFGQPASAGLDRARRSEGKPEASLPAAEPGWRDDGLRSNRLPVARHETRPAGN